MRLIPLLALFIISPSVLLAQQLFLGKVVDSQTGNPLPFATISISENTYTLSGIDGNFEFPVPETAKKISVSYNGYFPVAIKLEPTLPFYAIELKSNITQNAPDDVALQIIEKALQNKPLNNPRQALNSYTYKSYSKLLIDKQRDATVYPDTLNGVNSGGLYPRGFLSENVSLHLFEGPKFDTKIIEGFSTAGFEDPVYEILELNIEPISLYEAEYPIYDTRYAGPLSENSFKNYTYKILDTLNTQGRPGYVIHFKPKRPKIVEALEGVMHLDIQSFAIQKATLLAIGEIEIETVHTYNFYEKENLWFPRQQQLILKPGTGGKDITILGAIFPLGTVQRDRSIINRVFSKGEIEENLALTSIITHYDIKFNEPVNISSHAPAIKVLEDANQKSVNYWALNRQLPFSIEDELTQFPVMQQVNAQNILRIVEVREAVFNGFFPVGIWDFDLGRIINSNLYEGLRLGAGGQTNQNFSQRFRINGYIAYGFRDKAFKYEVGGGALLNQSTDTWWNLGYTKDIQEIATFNYLRGQQEFAIIMPRIPNIEQYYAFDRIRTSVQHKVTPRFDTELQLSRTNVTQILDYAFIHKDETYRDYTITEAQLGFLWRPFSKFISTPQFHRSFDAGYPQITGQVSKAMTGVLGGDFDFTKINLKAEHRIIRINESQTQFTLEGNYGFGTLPLTHAFHAFPNNPNRETIMDRFSIAGNISFETMYFNEFFSDRQAALHIKHYLRPIPITRTINPQLVFISRHVIGNFKDRAAHQNIEFNTLNQGYNEAGIELNKILFGFGLSAAYRYGAYHLPTFNENFAVKFTFQLQL